jgi:hypothetical protein
MYIYILTNYVPASIYTSSIAVSFRAGALISASGAYYNQLSSSISLNNPEFLKSYYKIFASDDYLQAEGIVFSLIALLLLLTSIFVLRESKL